MRNLLTAPPPAPSVPVLQGGEVRAPVCHHPFDKLIHGDGGLGRSEVQEEEICHVIKANANVHPSKALRQLEDGELTVLVGVKVVEGRLEVLAHLLVGLLHDGQPVDGLELHPVDGACAVKVHQAHEVVDCLLGPLVAHGHEGLKELPGLCHAVVVAVPGREDGPDLALLRGRQSVELLQARQHGLDSLLAGPAAAVHRPGGPRLVRPRLKANHLDQPGVVAEEALLRLRRNLADEPGVLFICY
mmetsp:Transcript_19151/g.60907  ORF Transcript_19151/g.60907 Transcript_19151/m.60907 type:complete len:244 (-) Transcript_19151:1129-1860(-)